MGILRIRESLDELLAKDSLDRDPYDLITLDEPHRPLRRARPGWLLAGFAGVFLCFLVTCFTFWKLSIDARDAVEQPYAYFEVKVIDPDGRPIAGASVKDGEKPLGVTDSFGEWRRFMRVKLGTTITLFITKRTPAGTLAAMKSMAVPVEMPESEELELVGSVQLLPSGARGKGGGRKKTPSRSSEAPALAGAARAKEVAAGGAVEAANAALNDAHLSSSPALEKPSREEASAERGDLAAVPMEEGDAQTALEDVSGVAVAKPLPGNLSEVASRFGASQAPLSFDSVWFLVEQGGEEALSEVVVALRKRARELGLKITPDAAWRVSLRHLDAGGGAADVAANQTKSNQALIQVVGSFHGQQGPQRLFSYLRNYQEAPLATARDILWAATIHVRKAFRVAHREDAWVVEPPAVRLFAVSAGRWLEDARGQVFRTIPYGRDPNGASVALLTTAGAPCAAGAQACEVTTPGLGRMPPVAGWQRLRLKVLGQVGDGVTVYVSGYEAQRREGGLYEYWGMPAGSANATVVRGGQVVYRGRVAGGVRQVATISLPSAPISRR